MNLIKPGFEKAYKKWCADFRWTDKLTDTVGKGVKNLMVVANDNKKIAWDTLTPDSWVLVMNDFDLSATKEYYEHGITNVVLLSTIDTAEDETVRQHVDNYIFNIVYKSPKFLAMLNTNGLPWKAILNLGNYPAAVLSGKKIKWQTQLQLKGDPEYMKRHFNDVIANPPYGKIGAQITEVITDKVDFDNFQLLLPLKDMASGGLDLCSHIDMSETVACPPHSFGDADILTHLMRITKTKNKTYASFEELVADSFIVDKPMIKFMKANALATHYAISNIKGYTSDCKVLQTFVFHTLRIISQHTAGMDLLTEETVANSYNLNNIIKPEIIKKSGGSGYKAICFNSEIEKQNFVNFYKANRNFINRMIANQFIGVRDYSVCFPKVDWTKDDWTIEKILKAVADYTDEEVQAVLDTMTEDYTIKDDASIERIFGQYLNKEN